MKRAIRIFFAVIRMSIGVGLLVYLGVSGAIHWSALLELAAAWPLTLAILLVLLMDMGITAWRLTVLMKPAGLHLPLFSSVRLTLMGTFFNACLPGSTGGDVVRIYYAMEGNHGKRTEIATIMLLDRAVGMFAMMIWPLLAAPFFPQLLESVRGLRGLLWVAAAVAAAMLVGMTACFSNRVRTSQWMSWALQRLPLGSHGGRMLDIVHVYRHSAGTLLASVGISLVAHTMSVGVMLLVAMVTISSSVQWEMCVLIPLGMLANTLPLTPGGLGVGEAAFDKLFSLAGVAGGAAVLLGWRLLMLQIGLIGLAFYLQGRKRFVHGPEVIPAMDAAARRA